MPEQEEKTTEHPGLPWLHGSDRIHRVDLAVNVAHLTSGVWRRKAPTGICSSSVALASRWLAIRTATIATSHIKIKITKAYLASAPRIEPLSFLHFPFLSKN